MCRPVVVSQLTCSAFAMPFSAFALTPFSILDNAFICLAMSLNFTMCARTIFMEVFARTALQATALPWTAFVQPRHLLVV